MSTYLVTGAAGFIAAKVCAQLLAAGHTLTLFTRGRQPLPAGVEHLAGDRSSEAGLQALEGRQFDVIVDSS